MQKSASILKRTSPLNFDHFRYQKPDFTASDLSTKVAALDDDAQAKLQFNLMKAKSEAAETDKKLKDIENAPDFSAQFDTKMLRNNTS